MVRVLGLCESSLRGRIIIAVGIGDKMSSFILMFLIIPLVCLGIERSRFVATFMLGFWHSLQIDRRKDSRMRIPNRGDRASSYGARVYSQRIHQQIYDIVYTSIHLRHKTFSWGICLSLKVWFLMSCISANICFSQDRKMIFCFLVYIFASHKWMKRITPKMYVCL